MSLKPIVYSYEHNVIDRSSGNQFIIPGQLLRKQSKLTRIFLSLKLES